MSAKISSIEKIVIKTKFAKIEKNLNTFNEDEHISFLNFCKQISEANFQSKSLQTFYGSNKLGKSMLFENKNFSVYIIINILLKLRKDNDSCLSNLRFL